MPGVASRPCAGLCGHRASSESWRPGVFDGDDSVLLLSSLKRKRGSACDFCDFGFLLRLSLNKLLGLPPTARKWTFALGELVTEPPLSSVLGGAGTSPGATPPPHGTATTWGGAAARSSLCCQKVSAGGLWCENQVKILCAVCLKHTRSLAEKLRLRLVCASLWGWALPSRASPPSLCDSHGAPSARGRGFRSCQVLGSLSLWFSACW